ncbi:methyltransferase domain-containing protein [Tropicimonas sp.]|uniref:methyltransferase domain-containing protein n=1 Tax=Tropicimonas sp. TaxID=2067044 RepID=UPI003A89589F
MSATPANDWNPGAYLRFRGLRLRPALDLLSAVPDLPTGGIADLGCGSGAIAGAMAARFPARSLTGIDSSPAMLDAAREGGGYDTLTEADIAAWRPAEPPALIFSNAALHWLGRHDLLFPRLMGFLAPGGTLAVQMPRQFEAPSHSLLRKLAAALFPDRFDWSDWRPPVAPPEAYFTLLAPMGEAIVWETVYYQRLAATDEGHPVRAFTRSTAARPILDRLSASEAGMFLAAYDASLDEQYPAQPDGSVLFPFRRLFLVVTAN